MLFEGTKECQESKVDAKINDQLNNNSADGCEFATIVVVIVTIPVVVIINTMLALSPVIKKMLLYKWQKRWSKIE